MYAATHRRLGKRVAVKVLRSDIAQSEEAVQRFLREGETAAKISHPHVIDVTDVGIENDQPFLVMEFLEGESLSAVIRRESFLSMERIADIMLPVIAAVDAAHTAGVIHRDLKPDNILLTRGPAGDIHPKVLDFGIARLINEGATKSLTRDGEVFGTPHYMAPEQAQGKKNVGPAADVYAMGIMLYEMVVGACPFDAPTPLAVLFMHINDTLPDVVPKVGIVLPESLREVIAVATAKEPEHRYQDAAEMLKVSVRSFKS